MKKVVAVVGPTASGKTKLAIDLAKRFKGVIISCDSVSVYKGCDIGSAKPSIAERKEAKHYLIDILDLTESFDVATCQKMARDIIDKEDLSIICGGTGLYLNAIINNYDFIAPKRNIEFSNKYTNYSNEELYALLKINDEVKAKEIHPNNRKRVLRALEASLSGNNLSLANKKNEDIYDAYIIYLDIPRDILYDRINNRVDQMISLGLEKEAYNLYKEGLLPNAIGYKEFIPYFNNLITLDSVIEEIKKNTRHLAKRQRTWFKNQTKAIFYDALDYDKLLDKVVKDLSLFLEDTCEYF